MLREAPGGSGTLRDAPGGSGSRFLQSSAPFVGETVQKRAKKGNLRVRNFASGCSHKQNREIRQPRATAAITEPSPPQTPPPGQVSGSKPTSSALKERFPSFTITSMVMVRMVMVHLTTPPIYTMQVHS